MPEIDEEPELGPRQSGEVEGFALLVVLAGLAVAALVWLLSAA